MTEEPPKKSPLSLGIEIDSDGRVVFTDLPQDLIDLVYELDPDAQLGCDLLLSPKTEENEHEQEGSASGESEPPT